MIPFPFQSGQLGFAGMQLSRKLLLPMDSNFNDISLSPHTISTTGTAPTIDGTDPKFGAGCGLFGGSGGLTSASNADWGPGLLDWTVQMWAKTASIQSGDVSLFQVRNTGQGNPNSGGISMGLQNGKLFCGPADISYGPIAAAAISTGVYVHLAAVRRNGNIYIYVDGTQVGTAADTNNYPAKALWIGTSSDAGGRYNGRLDDVAFDHRAIYTANFTPPSSALSPG